MLRGDSFANRITRVKTLAFADLIFANTSLLLGSPVGAGPQLQIAPVRLLKTCHWQFFLTCSPFPLQSVSFVGSPKTMLGQQVC